MTDIRPPYASKLRIGDRVRCVVGDNFIDEGTEGMIVNVAPPRYQAPARARILWDTDCVSVADETTFEVLAREDPAAAVQGLRKDMGASA